MFEMEFKFSKISSMRLKAYVFTYFYICLRLSEPKLWLTTQTTLYALRHRLSKQAFVEGNGKNICMKKICKFGIYLQIDKACVIFLKLFTNFPCSQITIR